jgi:hypothetical protein
MIKEDTVDDIDFASGSILEGDDRLTLLRQAAQELDARRSHLGPSQGEIPNTAEGDLVREMMEDAASFEGFPRVYKITEKDFLVAKAVVPNRFKELSKSLNFYELRSPIYLHPAPQWAFNRLEMMLVLRANNMEPHVQPLTYQILPSKEFQNVVSIDGHIEVRLDEDFKFSASTPTFAADTDYAKVSAGAGISTQVDSGGGMVIGPFQYHLKKVRLDHSPVGTQKVWWRLDGTKFFEGEDLGLIVIIQVPKATKEIEITAAMMASRAFKYAPTNLFQAIQQLPQAMRAFFENGTPLRSQTTWDISPCL